VKWHSAELRLAWSSTREERRRIERSLTTVAAVAAVFVVGGLVLRSDFLGPVTSRFMTSPTTEHTAETRDMLRARAAAAAAISSACSRASSACQRQTKIDQTKVGQQVTDSVSNWLPFFVGPQMYRQISARFFRLATCLIT